MVFCQQKRKEMKMFDTYDTYDTYEPEDILLDSSWDEVGEISEILAY